MEEVMLVDSCARQELLQELAASGHVTLARHPPVLAAYGAGEGGVHVGRLAEDGEIHVDQQRGVAGQWFVTMARVENHLADALDRLDGSRAQQVRRQRSALRLVVPAP